MFTTIIFDFFDVIRTDPSKAWLKQNGIERTAQYDKLFKRLDLGEIVQEEFINTLSKYSGMTEEAINSYYDSTELIDEATIHLIKRLKPHYKIGLLSNAPSKYLRNILKKHSHEGLFDKIVISGEVKLVKPSSEVFHHILEKLESKPQETIFIDDNIKNVRAAEELGITGVQFINGSQLEQALKELNVN
jgi:HAD superfamily hydrolase (TIGR01509 family)